MSWMSLSLWTVYVLGYLFLVIAIAMEDLKRSKLKADSMICSTLLMPLWPVFLSIFLFLTGIYIAVWLCMPTIRNGVSLKNGIRDFWS